MQINISYSYQFVCKLAKVNYCVSSRQTMAERIVHIPADAPLIAPSLIENFERRYRPFLEALAAKDSETDELPVGSGCEQLPSAQDSELPVGSSPA